jgi:heptosyltransferase-2
MALPALAEVRAAFPSSSITVAAQASIAPLFQEETVAAPDAVITIADGKQEQRALREGRFDAAVLLPNSFSAAWSVRRAGIVNRWGYRANLRGLLLTRPVPRPRVRVHQSEYYRALVRALGCAELPRGAPAIAVRPETRVRADALLEAANVPMDATLVGFAPGAAYGHAKRWPPSRVAEVVARLARERDVVCLLVGASGDRDAAREIESTLPAGVGVVNITGRTDLRMLAGILARCAVFVSNDSGAMHLAAALGVPVAAIFGPTDERVTAPIGEHDILIHQVFCRPCMLRDCPIDHRCMKGITADAVFEVVSRRLEARA